MSAHLTLGIDATNLRHGGGRTHLIELLRAVELDKQAFRRVYVWGSRSTLKLLDERVWLFKMTSSALDGGLLRRVAWQRFFLSRELRRYKCDVLFVPGGSYAGEFSPTVVMNQNVLPFEWSEVRRYGLRLSALRLILLRFMQAHTFHRSQGVIFLSRYALNKVESITGELGIPKVIIPHGVNARFLTGEKHIRSDVHWSGSSSIQLLYVSTIDFYKNQCAVVEGVAAARAKTGIDFRLRLVGSAYPPALNRLLRTLAFYDPREDWATYVGPIDYLELHQQYLLADIGIWASSCETFGMILLEMMAANIPIVSSDRGPVFEILGNCGTYFDPFNPETLADALIRLVGSSEDRKRLSRCGATAVGAYSWERCANDTFKFLSKVYRDFKKCRRG